ncbi:dnaJ homolog subfamily B member 14 isoform X2 [Hermetia illucens]|uniref:dnaJ homolog subfamily B member 14 isoform X2 n=1 Tax=Hermetia illucens TaxID=343691 RepID=UPI0018CC63DF|nr:dnaJ homolog subfamily B member 14 isoform X2 [Hermetia illucens]
MASAETRRRNVIKCRKKTTTKTKMDGNRDEAERCIEIAQKAFVEGKWERAEKFLTKAERLYPTQRAKDLLEKVKSFPTFNPPPENTGDSAKDGLHRRNPPGSPKAERKHDAEYTAEQLEAVKRIKKCKDYYEVLGVTKEASDSEIKKSYKKLALQLHPDKNKAPGAVEAFKAVGNAVAILTDVEKRKSYDLRGSDEFVRHSNRHHYSEFTYTRGFESDVTAEELFNMFFGGGFPQQNVYMRQRRYHRAEHQQQREQSGYAALFNLLPILLLIGLSMMSSFFISDPIYSLTPTSKYSVQRRTNNLRVPYYVKDNFHTEYQGSVGRLEASVEEDFINHLKHACSRERNYNSHSYKSECPEFLDDELFIEVEEDF